MHKTLKEIEKLERENQERQNLRKDIKFIKKNVLVHAKKEAQITQSNYVYWSEILNFIWEVF